jgi:hypothetical protein
MGRLFAILHEGTLWKAIKRGNKFVGMYFVTTSPLWLCPLLESDSFAGNFLLQCQEVSVQLKNISCWE